MDMLFTMYHIFCLYKSQVVYVIIVTKLTPMHDRHFQNYFLMINFDGKTLKYPK